ncbi:hypothetical protein [Bradyrhizobium oligotrophicum]|uniref:hypothetical protein n=1 Tax=Bradyrhizobium oligotrophicum TaxID=44255 RepID=UPI003EC0C6CC
MRGKIVLICPTVQGRVLRHFNTTGSFVMVCMRNLPVGRAHGSDGCMSCSAARQASSARAYSNRPSRTVRRSVFDRADRAPRTCWRPKACSVASVFRPLGREAERLDAGVAGIDCLLQLAAVDQLADHAADAGFFQVRDRAELHRGETRRATSSATSWRPTAASSRPESDRRRLSPMAQGPRSPSGLERERSWSKQLHAEVGISPASAKPRSDRHRFN